MPNRCGCCCTALTATAVAGAVEAACDNGNVSDMEVGGSNGTAEHSNSADSGGTVEGCVQLYRCACTAETELHDNGDRVSKGTAE